MSALHARMERIPLCRPHYRLLVMGGLGLTFDGLDVAVLAFVLPVVSRLWGLDGLQTGLIGSSTLIGYLVGAVAAGVVGDRIGRRRVMMYALVVYCLATLAAALATNWEYFFACRTVAGLGTGAESVIIPTFVAEFMPSRVRGRLVGAVAGFFSFGYVGAALLGRFVVAVGDDGWRIVHVLTALPILLLLWWRRSVPESPRFLIARGDPEAAERVVGDLERRAERALGHPLGPPGPAGPEPPAERAGSRSPWRDVAALWRGTLGRRTATLWWLWLVVTFAFYGFFTFLPNLLARSGLSVVTSFEYAIVIYLAQIPGYYSAAFLNDLIDRRRTIAGYLLGGVVAAYLLSVSGVSSTTVLWGALLSFFMNGLYASMYAYTPEVYPTPLRAQGVGLASGFGRLGGIAAPIVIGVLFPSIGFAGVFGVTAVALLAGAVVAAVFGTATRNRTLEEIGADAVDGLAGTGGVPDVLPPVARPAVTDHPTTGGTVP